MLKESEGQTWGFEDSTENDLLKNNIKSTKPQLKYFNPLNNTARKTKNMWKRILPLKIVSNFFGPHPSYVKCEAENVCLTCSRTRGAMKTLTDSK